MENLFEYTQLMADTYAQVTVTDGDESAMEDAHYDFTNGATAFATYLLDELKENPKTIQELMKSLKQMVGDSMINNLILSQTEVFEA